MATTKTKMKRAADKLEAIVDAKLGDALVEFEKPAGTTRQLQVLFDPEPLEQFDALVGDNKPVFDCQASKVEVLEVGDAITVDGKPYTVADVRLHANGRARVALNKQLASQSSSQSSGG